MLAAAGCGSEDTATTDVAASSIQTKPLREMKHGFDLDKNKELTFGGITVSFPDYWIQYNDSSDNPFYCAETGDKIAELLFKYDKSDMTEDDFASKISEIIADYLEDKTSELSDVTIGVTSESEDIPAYTIGYNGKMDDNEMTGRCCFVYDPIDGGTLILDLRQTDNTEYMYFDDFNEMVSNIIVEGSIKQNPVEDIEPENIEEPDSKTVNANIKVSNSQGDATYEEEYDTPDETEENISEESEADTSYKVFPYPGEDEITNVDDYKSFYRNYQSAYNQKWYRMTMPIYSVSGNSIIVHDDLDNVLGMISVHFAEPNATSPLRRGDEVTVVALTRSKMLGALMMYSGYIDSMRKTANSIVDGQVIIIDDYVSFAQNYDSHDIGKTIQITAPVENVTESGFSIREGFPDDITSSISVELADGETTEGIKDGDVVTFIGETHSQMWNRLFVEDAHIGAAKGSNVVHYNETEAYAEKNKPKTYISCTAGQLDSDKDNNMMSAKDKYLGKDLEISGVIVDIDNKGKDFHIGANSSTGLADAIYCSVETEEQRQKLMKLSKGSAVTVRGNCYKIGSLVGYMVKLDDILTGY